MKILVVLATILYEQILEAAEFSCKGVFIGFGFTLGVVICLRLLS